MKAEEKIKKARVQLQRRNPFFAYLSLYITPKKDKNLPEYAGAGVDLKGNLKYKEEFIDKLSYRETMGVITHEILHLALQHLDRGKSKHRELWNIACDICVNSIIRQEGLELPQGCIIPKSDDSINIFNNYIQDCSKKSAEKIYSEIKIPEDKKQQMKSKIGGGSGSGEQQGDSPGGNGNQEEEVRKELGGFDKHERDDTGKELGEKEKAELIKKWQDKTQEAVVNAKMKGDVPAGVERLIENLHKEKIDWKSVLNQQIINALPYNYTYSKPHKKSRSIGTYLPDVEKEKIEVVVGIDTSGSIGEKELTDFLSEIIGIARAFQERLEMRLITHDVEVHNDYLVRNGNIQKIKNLKISGGGGTSHKPLYDYIKENYPASKVCIFLTDGMSDINNINQNEYAFDKLFIITSQGETSQIDENKCRVIKLEE